MGQFFIVQGTDVNAVRRVLDRGTDVARELTGLAPIAVEHRDRCSVAQFPRVAASVSPLQRGPAGWALVSGTWVHRSAAPAVAITTLAQGLLGSGGMDAALADMDGLFALVRYDARTDDLDLATDAIGRLHVYRTEVDGCLVVGTSALVLATLRQAAFDPQGLWEFVGTGSVFETRSLFADVEKLDRGTVFTFRAGRLVHHARWFDPAQWLYDRGKPEGDVRALCERLVAAVGATLRAHDRPVIDVTGGFDSRAILGAALRSGASFATVVNGSDSDPDVVSANRIAKVFGLDHRQQRPGTDYGRISFDRIRAALALTDGEFDAVEYAGVMEIQETLAQRGGVTVNGSAGELCRGYWWDLAFPHVGQRAPLDPLRAARRFAQDDWADELLDRRPEGRLVDSFREVTTRAVASLGGLPNTAHADHLYLTMRMQRWAGRLASATNRIWPCATPFLFREPMTVAIASPIGMRRGNRMTRLVIEALDPKLAALPMAGGYPASPIRLGNVLQFAPLASEFATKALRRIRRKLIGAPSSRPGPSAAAELWRDPRIEASLDPASMLTASLYRAPVLSEFLNRSRREGFAEVRKVGRILTIELVARTLRNCRAK